MKFKTYKENLLTKVQFAASVVAGKAIIPILGNFLLELEGDSLTISSTNTVQTVKCHCEVDGIADGKCTVPAKKLLALVNSFADSSDVTIDSNENNVNISTPQASFSLNSLSADDFPDTMPDMSDAESFDIPTPALAQMISVCSNAICKDDSRPMLTGMLFDFADNAFTGCATDGKRMSIVESVESDIALNGKVVVPQTALNLVGKLAGDTITVSFNEKNIVFSSDKFTFASKVIAGNFPNYKAVIPQSYKNEFHFETNVLINAIKQITIVAEADQFIKILFGDNSAVIFTCNSGVGTGTVTVTGDCQPDAPCSVSLNPKFLLDALAGAAEEITIKINDDRTPLCIERAENNYTILMPIRAK